MAKFIDDQFWKQSLLKPDWYLKLGDDFKRLERLAGQRRAEGQDETQVKAIKGEAYSLVEEALREGKVALGETGEDFDCERRPVDTIVIHHTKNPPGMSLERLNAMHLLRLYAPYYASNVTLRGQPIWSNHFRAGQPVFYGYHWLVSADGGRRLLDDAQIAWHAGCWHVNTRSVAICIDDDLTGKEPSQATLVTIADLIKSNYPQLADYLVIGHCEVLDSPQATGCPGEFFLSCWKKKLLDLLK